MNKVEQNFGVCEIEKKKIVACYLLLGAGCWLLVTDTDY